MRQIPRIVISLTTGFIATGAKMVCVWIAVASLASAFVIGRLFAMAGPTLMRLALSLVPAIKIP